jgi:hypothetical protein
MIKNSGEHHPHAAASDARIEKQIAGKTTRDMKKP